MSWKSTDSGQARASGDLTPAGQGTRAPYEPPRVLKKRAVTQVTFTSSFSGSGGSGGFHINP
jgi:hypothetical protein